MIRDSLKRREDHPRRQMLKFWDDAFQTSLSAVVKHVVALTTIAIRSRNWAPQTMLSNAGEAGTAERCVTEQTSLPFLMRDA